jgi:methionine sulfoxide reductase heme-binding subunit
MIAGANVTWYAARAGGLVALALLTLATLAGLLLAGRPRLQRWPRFAVEDVHRFLGLLTGTFVGLHVLVLLVDPYQPFSVAQLVVPGLSSYRPLPTALGVVGAELLLALALTNRFRIRLPYLFWRRIHFLNFAVWGLALAHGVTAGADGDTGWALALYTVCGSAVAAATVWRALRARPLPGWALGLWTGTAGLVGAELVVALVLGRGAAVGALTKLLRPL